MTDAVFETCDECGFDAAEWPAASARDELRSLAVRWYSVLRGQTDRALRRRPQPEVWSALEYAMHTALIVSFWRDTAEHNLAGRVASMGDRTYPDADREPYNDLAVDTVVDALSDELEALAGLAAGLDDDDLRTPLRLDDPAMEEGFRSFGVGDVRGMVAHGLHDALHHLGDVERGLSGVT